ncbi:hypothetical protein ABFS83_07G069300 [Erythranthe nasuta]
MYHLFPFRQEERSALGIPLDEISNLSVQPKYNISLQERLEGWVVQERKRNGSKPSDKYYIHEKVSGNFRSLKEFALFILYSYRRENLETIENEKNFVHNDISSEEENTLEENMGEEDNEMDSEEFSIFSYAYDNPITKL